MIFNLLEPLRAAFRAKSQPKSDNFVFRLHYRVTTIIFLVAAIFLITVQLFGEPIRCFTHGSAHVEDYYAETMARFCWVTSSYIVKDHLCARRGTEVPYAGIGILTPNRTPFDVHVTYRFLFFVIFLQGISFYMPHLIWKSWESDKMKMLSGGLEHPLLDHVHKRKMLHSLIDYTLQGHMNGSIKYSVHLHFCELMNLILVGVNIWVTDYLFQGEFVGYGFKALGDWFSGSNKKDYDFNSGCSDPIKALFPQVTKCAVREVGASGSIVNHDYECILMLNDFNANFFKFSWVWFFILLVASLIWLTHRMVAFYSRWVRSFLLSRRAGRFEVPPTHSHDGNCAGHICSRINYADWVIIMQLGRNMDPLTYKLFLEQFCLQIEVRETGKSTKMIDKIYYSPV